MKKFKKMITYIAMIVMVFGIIGLAGCKPLGSHDIHEEGYFQYIIFGKNSRFPKNKSDGVIAIVGFSELGKEQEVIDIPRTIAGKDVWQIGYGPMTQYGYGGGNYLLESPNLKKIYIHDNIKVIYDEAFFNWSHYYDFDNLEIMLCVAKEFVSGLDGNDIKGFIYIYREIFYEKDEWYSKAIQPANITFLNNYSTEINAGYYRLDNIESGEKILKPSNPEREGYIFTNWFTEPECLNVWNFDMEKQIVEGEEFKLYAGWRVI